MDMKKLQKRQIAAIVILLLQLAGGIFLGVEVFILNMFPMLYMGLGIGALVVLLVINTLLMLVVPGKNKEMKTAGKLCYCIGATFGVIIAVLSVVAGGYIMKLNHTVSAITTKTTTSNVVNVYVMADSDMEKIEDASRADFAITEQFDYDNTKLTIEEINRVVDSKINTVSFSAVTNMVDALYRGEVDTIILNESYVDILEDQEKYENFESKVKCIFSYEIVEEAEEPEVVEEEELTEKPFVVYLSGNDTRATTLQTGHSDVNILAYVNPITHQILLVNTPRDYYIPSTASAYHSEDKLTHCGLYGTDCSMGSLGLLYESEIKYYFQVNFTGFERLIDDMGGITVESEKTFTSRDGYTYYAGSNTLNGAKALSFARERKAFAAGDHMRGQNQMRIIKAMIEKFRSSDTLLANFSGLLADLEGMFQTNFSDEDLKELTRFQLENNVNWDIKSYAVSGRGASMTTYSTPSSRAYVMIPDETTVLKAKELIAKISNGGYITDADLEVVTSEAEQ